MYGEKRLKWSVAMRSKQTILVVEDDRQLRKALTTKLDQIGYKVVSAPDGEAGLKLALDKQPDLLILDMLMPKLNGNDMLKMLRKDRRGKHIPVVVLTNDASPKSAQAAIKRGAPAYFSKASISLAEVVEVVRYHLGD